MSETRIDVVRRCASEERPLHVGAEWVRELAAEIDALIRPAPVAASDAGKCIGCGSARIAAIRSVVLGRIACCPDCSTLTMGERNAIREAVALRLRPVHPSAAAVTEAARDKCADEYMAASRMGLSHEQCIGVALDAFVTLYSLTPASEVQP